MVRNATHILGRIADIASADVGSVFESPRGSNRGPTLDKFFRADNYKPGLKDEGYPWCAAAVDCWVQEFLSDAAARPLFGHLSPPRTPAAFGLITWGEAVGCLVFSARMCAAGKLWPQRGDIAVFTFSHCGIVSAVSQRDRNFACIEGNTDSQGSREGWEVAVRPRTFAQVRRFVRLVPRAAKGDS